MDLRNFIRFIWRRHTLLQSCSWQDTFLTGKLIFTLLNPMHRNRHRLTIDNTMIRLQLFGASISQNMSITLRVGSPEMIYIVPMESYQKELLTRLSLWHPTSAHGPLSYFWPIFPKNCMKIKKNIVVALNVQIDTWPRRKEPGRGPAASKQMVGFSKKMQKNCLFLVGVATKHFSIAVNVNAWPIR